MALQIFPQQGAELTQMNLSTKQKQTHRCREQICGCQGGGGRAGGMDCEFRVVNDTCDPTDCSLPGSPIHGIFQTRVLEWVAIAFSAVVTYPILNQKL